LSKNDELMRVLGYENHKQIADGVKYVHTAKDGCLLWDEFIDFFFLKGQMPNKGGIGGQQQTIDPNENWWRKIGKPKEEPKEEVKQQTVSPQKKVPRYG
jgi:hypothetical protein